MKVETIFCGGNGILKCKREEGGVGEKGDELLDFALAEGGSVRRDAEEELFEGGRKAGSGEEEKGRVATRLALLRMIMVSPVWREKAR